MTGRWRALTACAALLVVLWLLRSFWRHQQRFSVDSLLAIDGPVAPNLLMNPSWIVGARHWHSFRLQAHPEIDHFDELDSVDGQKIHRVLVMDGPTADPGGSVDARGLFQYVTLHADALPANQTYYIEFAAKVFAHGLKKGVRRFEASIDILFSDGSHMLDVTLPLPPSARTMGSAYTRHRDHDWQRACVRVAAGGAAQRTPRHVAVYLLLEGQSGGVVYVSDVSLRVVPALDAEQPCAFQPRVAGQLQRSRDAGTTLVLRSDAPARATARAVDDVVDWTLPTVRQVQLLEARTRKRRRGHDVTAVTLASMDRFDRVLVFAPLWQGPMTAAVLARSVEDMQNITTQWQASPASQFVTIRIMMSIEEETEDEAPFPINELRNAAIDLVKTSHFLVVDADFVPSKHARHVLIEHLDTLKRMNFDYAAFADNVVVAKETPVRPRYAALIVPAFEALELNAQQAAALSKRELVHRWAANDDPRPAHVSFASAAQAPTRFDTWQNARRPYFVPYAPHFEPYYVVPRDAVRYDQRFRGYGADKSEHCYAQHRLHDALLLVVPDAWVTHIAHPKASWKTAQINIIGRVWKNWYARLLEADQEAVGRVRHWLTLEHEFSFVDWTKPLDCCVAPDPCYVLDTSHRGGHISAPAADFSYYYTLLALLFVPALLRSVARCQHNMRHLLDGHSERL